MVDIKIFSVQSDIESVQKTFASLGKDIAKSALPQAISQIGAKAFTKSVKVASKFLGVPKQNLLYGSAGKSGESSKPIMSQKKANSKSLTHEIKVKSRWLHLSEDYFKPKKNKGGVESIYHSNYNSNPSGSRLTYLGAFIGKAQNSGKKLVYKPTGKFKMVQGKRKMIKRPILKALWAFNPAREFTAKGISDAILNEFAPQIKKRYEDKLNQYIARHQSKMKKI